MSRWLSLSVEAMGTCCSATRRGSSGGGSDCAPMEGISLSIIYRQGQGYGRSMLVLEIKPR